MEEDNKRLATKWGYLDELLKLQNEVFFYYKELVLIIKRRGNVLNSLNILSSILSTYYLGVRYHYNKYLDSNKELNVNKQDYEDLTTNKIILPDKIILMVNIIMDWSQKKGISATNTDDEEKIDLFDRANRENT